MRRRLLQTAAARAPRIAFYPGDGIGVDVTDATLRLLEHAQSQHNFALETTVFDWNSSSYADANGGRCAPDDMIDILRPFDAIFLGAVGWPAARPDHETLEPLIRLRQAFQQFACVRPARTYHGVPTPLASGAPVDMVVVRENSEGEYVHVGGRVARGTPDEVAVQTAVHTRRGVERVLRYGIEAARERRGKLTLVTKSNAQRFGMAMWEDVLAELDCSGVEVDVQHVDACCMNFVRRPESFDVVVASNLFGDILTDLSGAVTGSLGLNPSANLDPTRANPSLFEPVHGSAPDIAGKGVANPVGAFLSAATMLEWLAPSGVPPAAGAAIRRAVEESLAARESTADAGGALGTSEVTEAVMRRL